MKDCIIPKVQDTVQIVGNAVLPKSTTGKPVEPNSVAEDVPGVNSTASTSTDSPEPVLEQGVGDRGIRTPNKTSIMSALSLENFEPRQAGFIVISSPFLLCFCALISACCF